MGYFYTFGEDGEDVGYLYFQMGRWRRREGHDDDDNDSDDEI